MIQPENNKEISAIVQVRHRHKGVPAIIQLAANSTVYVKFCKESAVVSPGQAAVFYDTTNTQVLGGGRISSFSCNTTGV